MTQTQGRAAAARHSTGAVGVALHALVVLGLLIDAAVHTHLAPEYELAFPDGIGGGTLFYVQAGVAGVTAVGVVIWRHRAMYAIAFAVAISAFATVVLSRYVELPGVGPLPAMYEPLWFFEKSASAVAEGLAALAALALFVLRAPRGAHDRGQQREAPVDGGDA